MHAFLGYSYADTYLSLYSPILNVYSGLLKVCVYDRGEGEALATPYCQISWKTGGGGGGRIVVK
jgi:hypothetical protein